VGLRLPGDRPGPAPECRRQLPERDRPGRPVPPRAERVERDRGPRDDPAAGRADEERRPVPSREPQRPPRRRRAQPLDAAHPARQHEPGLHARRQQSGPLPPGRPVVPHRRQRDVPRRLVLPRLGAPALGGREAVQRRPGLHRLDDPLRDGRQPSVPVQRAEHRDLLRARRPHGAGHLEHGDPDDLLQRHRPRVRREHLPARPGPRRRDGGQLQHQLLLAVLPVDDLPDLHRLQRDRHRPGVRRDPRPLLDPRDLAPHARLDAPALRGRLPHRLLLPDEAGRRGEHELPRQQPPHRAEARERDAGRGGQHLRHPLLPGRRVDARVLPRPDRRRERPGRGRDARGRRARHGPRPVGNPAHDDRHEAGRVVLPRPSAGERHPQLHFGVGRRPPPAGLGRAEEREAVRAARLRARLRRADPHAPRGPRLGAVLGDRVLEPRQQVDVPPHPRHARRGRADRPLGPGRPQESDDDDRPGRHVRPPRRRAERLQLQHPLRRPQLHADEPVPHPRFDGQRDGRSLSREARREGDARRRPLERRGRHGHRPERDVRHVHDERVRQLHDRRARTRELHARRRRPALVPAPPARR
jgi:hypothetical protein